MLLLQQLVCSVDSPFHLALNAKQQYIVDILYKVSYIIIHYVFFDSIFMSKYSTWQLL